MWYGDGRRRRRTIRQYLDIGENRRRTAYDRGTPGDAGTRVVGSLVRLTLVQEWWAAWYNFGQEVKKKEELAISVGWGWSSGTARTPGHVNRPGALGLWGHPATRTWHTFRVWGVVGLVSSLPLRVGLLLLSWRASPPPRGGVGRWDGFTRSALCAVGLVGSGGLGAG